MYARASRNVRKNDATFADVIPFRSRSVLRPNDRLIAVRDERNCGLTGVAKNKLFLKNIEAFRIYVSSLAVPINSFAWNLSRNMPQHPQHGRFLPLCSEPAVK
jgi:hypothetical protein